MANPLMFCFLNSLVSKEFYNYFTTPSGKYCIVREISNDEYLVLCKFTESQNIKGFFSYLDKIIEETIADFQSFTLADKLYTYIAFTLYSIKASIGINTKAMGNQKVPLVNILNAIEELYDEKVHYYDVGDITLEISSPIKTMFDENCNPDYLSGISGVRMNNSSIKISENERQQLIENLSQQTLMEIQSGAREWLRADINIFRGMPMPAYVINVNSADSLMMVFSVVGESLESFYWKQFVGIQYIRISYDGIMKMTPIELDIMIKNFQKMLEEANKDKSGVQPTAGFTDPIM